MKEGQEGSVSRADMKGPGEITWSADFQNFFFSFFGNGRLKIYFAAQKAL